MTKMMLIDATQVEETRVAVVKNNRLEEFDFETASNRPLKGNIYLAKVTRVEPSLQAAFVEYGGNRQGFLSFSEIHPDYYQIPIADRQALIEEELEREQAEAKAEDDADDPDQDDDADQQEASADDDDATEDESSTPTAELSVIDAVNTAVEITQGSEDNTDSADVDDTNTESAEDDDTQPRFEAVSTGEGRDDEREEIPAPKRRSFHRRYKIQEVIKKNQIILIQIVKEERGNKGAAVTTYLSMPGRYCVLMPNTPRGGGISRKVTNSKDRKRLKEVAQGLEVQRGMGVILRTAGATRTKLEIRRDFEYLMRLWTNVRDLTLQSVAPALVYEEGSLIKRSIRDLYVKDIEEIYVDGDEGYKEAKAFMKMLMPSHAKNVKQYKEKTPLFSAKGVEGQLDQIHDMQVTLKSGGYLVINQTEALVAIDVNSGKSTREHNIEDTALKTNLEAAEEVARQLRLRDLAGLVVIDFIDMDHWRNNRTVEKKLREALKQDRARIQVGRISPFGLMEMSRQRMRQSVIENTMQTCEACFGSGRQLSPTYMALRILRNIEEQLLDNPNIERINVQTFVKGALYLLNNKRDNLTQLEATYGVTINVEAVERLPEGQTYNIQKTLKPKDQRVANTKSRRNQPSDSQTTDEPAAENESDTPSETSDEQENKGRRRRRRGGRGRNRGGRGRDNQSQNTDEDSATSDSQEPNADKSNEKSDQTSDDSQDNDQKDDKDKRTRSRRRPRRNSEEGASEAESDGLDDTRSAEKDEKPSRSRTPSYKRYREAKTKNDNAESPFQSAEASSDNASQDAPAKKAESDTSSRAKPAAALEAETTEKKTKVARSTKTPKPAKSEAAAQEKVEDGNRPKRRGWWSKRLRSSEAS